jgi:hypothetical protein
MLLLLSIVIHHLLNCHIQLYVMLTLPFIPHTIICNANITVYWNSFIPNGTSVGRFSFSNYNMKE